MELGEGKSERRPPAACRQEAALEAFVTARISANAWPIHSRPLRREIGRRGLDLEAAENLTLAPETLERLMRRIFAHEERAERMLRIDVAFHRPVHNLEVFLRLLLLEWPPGAAIPPPVRSAAETAYTTFEAIAPLLDELMDRLLALGLAPGRLVRDLLAAVGHDYGHVGGTDRLDGRGEPLTLTHEEAAERHVAKFGLELDLPPALILESLAGIRATTFHLRPGRRPIRPANDFERRLMLADVAGCILPPDRWLTHVALPVLSEKIGGWKGRLEEVPGEIDDLRRRRQELPPVGGERRRCDRRLSELAAEERGMARDLRQLFRSELEFLRYIRSHRLTAVPAGERLWGANIARTLAAVERVLAREDLLAPLAGCGFPLVEELTRELANAPSLAAWLDGDGVDEELRQLLAELLV